MFEADKTLGAHRWPVVRLGANSKVEVTLLSKRFFELTTHWNKCTLPCCGDNCRLCELLPARGLFYAAGMCNSRVSIIELACQSASHCEQHCKLLWEGMRPGLVIELSRRGAKQPVRSEGIRFVEKAIEVAPLELASKVMALYKFPTPNPGDSIEDYELRCRTVAKVRCDRSADLLCKSAAK